jgi:hypothetical protein
MYGDKSAGLNGRFADGLFSPMITQVCKNYGGSPERRSGLSLFVPGHLTRPAHLVALDAQLFDL